MNFPRFLDPTIKMWSALAIDTKKNKAVGMMNFLSHPSIWDMTENIFLNDLYVEKNEIVRGSLVKKQKKWGLLPVYWTTDHFNHRAQLIYTKISKLSPKCICKRSLD